jgi:hypothetical protein
LAVSQERNQVVSALDVYKEQIEHSQMAEERYPLWLGFLTAQEEKNESKLDPACGVSHWLRLTNDRS